MECQIHLLETAMKQMEAEIASARSDIKSFLMDPTVMPLDPADDHSSLAYNLHLKIHHLSENITALKVTQELYAEYAGMDSMEEEEEY